MMEFAGGRKFCGVSQKSDGRSASGKIWWTNFPSGRFYCGPFYRGRFSVDVIS